MLKQLEGGWSGVMWISSYSVVSSVTNGMNKQDQSNTSMEEKAVRYYDTPGWSTLAPLRYG